jgi:hypothetical protein
MNARALLADLCARDVRVTAVGGRLRVDAPAGVLTAADREALAAHKPTIMALLDAQCLDCGEALPPGHLYRCRECTTAAWRRTYGSVPPSGEDNDAT